MASELLTASDTGLALYALLRNRAGQVWNTATPGFETYASANYAAYAIALVEQGASGYYLGNLPAVPSNAQYTASFACKPAGAGATAAENDPRLTGVQMIDWGAGALTVLAGSLPSSSAGTAGGLPTGDASGRVAIQVGTAAGQINASNGKVPATLDPADVAGTPTGVVASSPGVSAFAMAASERQPAPPRSAEPPPAAKSPTPPPGPAPPAARR